MFKKDDGDRKSIVGAPEIDTIKVLPLHGDAQMFSDSTEALAFITGYTWNEDAKTLVRFEITVNYKDGSWNEVGLPNREKAIEFLKNRQEGIL